MKRWRSAVLEPSVPACAALACAIRVCSINDLARVEERRGRSAPLAALSQLFDRSENPNAIANA
jgi:hypothetical protein